MSQQLIVRVTNDAQEVRDLIAKGYCAVECGIDGTSIVCPLEMDHHCERAHLESVAIRAYRDHFGARAEDPRFVVVGAPDADATFAIASLAGLLPHPSVVVQSYLPDHVKKAMQKDITPMAQTIAVIDTDPIGRDLTTMEYGEDLLFWNALMAHSKHSDMSAVAGVFLWSQVAADAAPRKPLIAAAKVTEANRRETAKGDKVIRISDQVGYLEDSQAWAFDVWYGRKEDHPADSLRGWEYSCILSYVDATKAITIGCPNDHIAEKLFGKGGLDANVFPLMAEEGWGGRIAIGGSPRDREMTLNELKGAADIVANFIKERLV